MFNDLSKTNRTVIYILLVFTGIIILKNAWVGDDAYIGFRTVYNFSHGYGLRFNINERVQSFTNPLWIMLMSGFYYFTGEAYFTSIISSLIITLILVYYLMTKLSADLSSTFLVVSLIVCSKAFIDYSTSGLENALAHLFIVLFAVIYFGELKYKLKLFLMCFIAALAGVNRLDNLLLYLIPLIVQLRFISLKNILIMCAGFIPVILWEVFSVIYYGFPFPNTYYAKLNTDISQSEYTLQGIRYLINSLDIDSITLISIVTAFALGLAYTFKRKKYNILPFALSILIYVYYTVKVGGDFMSGRFLTYPFLISIIIFLKIDLQQISKWIIVAVAIAAMLFSPYCPVKSDSSYRKAEGNWEEIVHNSGIADERGWYYPRTGLLKMSSTLYVLQEVEGKLNSPKVKCDTVTSFAISEVVLGFCSYTAGPSVYIFHQMGLSDPLIACLPRDLSDPAWRVGHVVRKIPEGYSESLRHGRNEMTDKNLALLYDDISTIIRGDIFTKKRFNLIYELNTGKLDYLIDRKFYSSAK